MCTYYRYKNKIYIQTILNIFFNSAHCRKLHFSVNYRRHQPNGQYSQYIKYDTYIIYIFASIAFNNKSTSII